MGACLHCTCAPTLHPHSGCATAGIIQMMQQYRWSYKVRTAHHQPAIDPSYPPIWLAIASVCLRHTPLCLVQNEITERRPRFKIVEASGFAHAAVAAGAANLPACQPPQLTLQVPMLLICVSAYLRVTSSATWLLDLFLLLLIYLGSSDRGDKHTCSSFDHTTLETKYPYSQISN